MLVLSRMKNQKIRIGDDIVIVVIESCDGKVRLGIDAPREIPVHRGEVYDEIQRKKRSRNDTDLFTR